MEWRIVKCANTRYCLIAGDLASEQFVQNAFNHCRTNGLISGRSGQRYLVGGTLSQATQQRLTPRRPQEDTHEEETDDPQHQTCMSDLRLIVTTGSAQQSCGPC